jgi:hypothetical protein
MNIAIKTIPHSEHRYPTCGDWWWTPDGDLEIRVSKMSDWRYEVLVGFHELCEVLICKHLGITQAEVDAFDIKFEADRELGIHTEDEEPGDHKDAPYRVQHFIATNCERILALALGVNWADYDNEVVSL